MSGVGAAAPVIGRAGREVDRQPHGLVGVVGADTYWPLMPTSVSLPPPPRRSEVVRAPCATPVRRSAKALPMAFSMEIRRSVPPSPSVAVPVVRLTVAPVVALLYSA